LCITAISKDGQTAGASKLSGTTISTGDTTLTSINRTLHAAPAANGRLLTAVPHTNREGGDADAVEEHESVEEAHKAVL
jgi:hypothetical protein